NARSSTKEKPSSSKKEVRQAAAAMGSGRIPEGSSRTSGRPSHARQKGLQGHRPGDLFRQQTAVLQASCIGRVGESLDRQANNTRQKRCLRPQSLSSISTAAAAAGETGRE